MMIKPHETEIQGQWKLVGLNVESDASARRIEALINGYLKPVAQDETGWSTLYVDPADQRLWELTYPQSDSHGGGPPMLRCLSPQEAQEKYGGAASL